LVGITLAVLFCSNIKETHFFLLHIVIAGIVSQRFLLTKKNVGKIVLSE